MCHSYADHALPWNKNVSCGAPVDKYANRHSGIETTDLDHRSACSFPFLTVLSILTAVSSPTVVYPKVVLTVVFIPTVVYILTVVSSLCDYSS